MVWVWFRHWHGSRGRAGFYCVRVSNNTEKSKSNHKNKIIEYSSRTVLHMLLVQLYPRRRLTGYSKLHTREGTRPSQQDSVSGYHGAPSRCSIFDSIQYSYCTVSMRDRGGSHDTFYRSITMRFVCLFVGGPRSIWEEAHYSSKVRTSLAHLSPEAQAQVKAKRECDDPMRVTRSQYYTTRAISPLLRYCAVLGLWTHYAYARAHWHACIIRVIIVHHRHHHLLCLLFSIFVRIPSTAAPSHAAELRSYFTYMGVFFSIFQNRGFQIVRKGRGEGK
jgi:hypothetical protein